MTINCPLCNTPGIFFTEHRKKKYYNCPTCLALFLDPAKTLSGAAEKARYLEHNNDVNDIGYQQFVMPIVTAVKNNFNSTASGLDFGAGTGPVISKILREANYQIDLYDPFFHDQPELLTQTYDYIVCCEVIEHFKDPAKEFALLRSLLKPGGKLFCMTTIYNKDINFNNWYYKNDATHCFFYQTATLEWIKKKYNFNDLKISGNLIELTNR